MKYFFISCFIWVSLGTVVQAQFKKNFVNDTSKIKKLSPKLNPVEIQDKKNDYLKRVFHLYPNPADKKATLIDESPEILQSLELYDCLGRKINSSYSLTDRQAIINTQSIPSGVYLLNIIQELDKNVIMLIIRH
jgi:hypothetical protein